MDRRTDAQSDSGASRRKASAQEYRNVFARLVAPQSHTGWLVIGRRLENILRGAFFRGFNAVSNAYSLSHLPLRRHSHTNGYCDECYAQREQQRAADRGTASERGYGYRWSSCA